MYRTFVMFLAIVGLFVSAEGQADAGPFLLGSSFNVAVTDDPNGANSPTNAVVLGAGPTLIDGGLLTVSQAITPITSASAYIQFTVSTPSGGPLAGTPSANWKIDITNITGSSPMALSIVWVTFLDANGASHPFIFPGQSLQTNPTNAAQSVSEGGPFPLGYATLNELFASLSPYDQGPTNFGTTGSTPVAFILGGEYISQVTPEPASVTLLGIGIAGMAGYAWRRRKQVRA